MTVFSSFFRVARRKLGSVLIYLGIMLVMSVLILSSLGEDMGQLSVNTSNYRIALINEDGGDALSQGLVEMLSSRAQVREIGTSERDIRDALFYREVDYVLVIPQGFGVSLREGSPMQIATWSSPNDYTHRYIDTYVNRFLGLYSLYQQRLPQEQPAQTLARAQAGLVGETQLTSPQVEADSRAQTTMAWYFRYLSYPLLAAISSGLGMVLVILNERRLVMRNRSASKSDASRAVQTGLAAWLYCSIIWLVLVLTGLIVSKFTLMDLAQPRFLLILLSSYLYMAVCVAISLMVSAFTRKIGVVSGISNVIALGSSFLGGVFVPVEVLGESVIRLGKAFPAYWYTAAVRAVGDTSILSPSILGSFWHSMGILALMLAVLLAASALVNRQRRIRGV